MPTARRRYQVTESDDVARALNEAAKEWPNEPRSRLILRVIRAGGDAVAQRERAIAEAKEAAIARVCGAYSGVFRADYLSHLRDDWPA